MMELEDRWYRRNGFAEARIYDPRRGGLAYSLKYVGDDPDRWQLSDGFELAHAELDRREGRV